MPANSKTNTVLITGSSRGIGLALAAEYQAAGWNVIAAARNPAKAEQLQSLNVYKTIQLDVADEASILRAAEELNGEAIDLLINNAGIAYPDFFLTETKERLMQTLEVNTVGPFIISRAFLPHLKAAVAVNGSAKIAQISSSMGSITQSTGELLHPSYRASKTALNMLNNVIAHSVKDEKIATVVLCPGFVDTDINGHTGYLKPSESASMVAKNIANLTLEDTGKFVNHEGTTIPW
ncbi:hypothetical protein Poli38472_007128 [Pythium oligandrum]|uniref:Short-chain dehydrogenase n=1 Tax=Pythium oligandrum TaxID=41045 RepID=A0A8K1C9N4_PYTOL|nr:hypothetical protein Poli38472_007128 [Pythium oligandrum]|eukprot:TMW58983.1 hypothetical protein Poli38472_007128 [Pythium oligandrum]